VGDDAVTRWRGVAGYQVRQREKAAQLIPCTSTQNRKKTVCFRAWHVGKRRYPLGLLNCWALPRAPRPIPGLTGPAARKCAQVFSCALLFIPRRPPSRSSVVLAPTLAGTPYKPADLSGDASRAQPACSYTYSSNDAPLILCSSSFAASFLRRHGKTLRNSCRITTPSFSYEACARMGQGGQPRTARYSLCIVRRVETKMTKSNIPCRQDTSAVRPPGER
jgi:hypothetical protein